MIFDPYTPSVGSFLLLSIGKFGQFLTLPPLKNADVLNGWSPRENQVKIENDKNQILCYKIFMRFSVIMFHGLT